MSKILKYKDWVGKFFGEMAGKHYLLYDRQVRGFAPQDLAYYSQKELKAEYAKFLSGKSEDQDVYERSN